MNFLDASLLELGSEGGDGCGGVGLDAGQELCGFGDGGGSGGFVACFDDGVEDAEHLLDEVGVAVVAF